MRIDPRLFATFDEGTRQWRITGGTYRLMLGGASDALTQTATITLLVRTLPATGHPASR